MAFQMGKQHLDFFMSLSAPFVLPSVFQTEIDLARFFIHVKRDGAGRCIRAGCTDWSGTATHCIAAMLFDPGDLISASRRQLFTFKAKHMLADRGYDADWYYEEPEAKGIMPCIPSRKGRRSPISRDAARHRQQHKTEYAFASFKDWWRVAPRYDRSRKVFLSACARAAVVMF